MQHIFSFIVLSVIFRTFGLVFELRSIFHIINLSQICFFCKLPTENIQVETKKNVQNSRVKYADHNGENRIALVLKLLEEIHFACSDVQLFRRAYQSLN